MEQLSFGKWEICVCLSTDNWLSDMSGFNELQKHDLLPSHFSEKLENFVSLHMGGWVSRKQWKKIRVRST